MTYLSAAQSVLADLWANADRIDGPTIERARAAAAGRGAFTDSMVADHLRDAYLPVDAPSARLLYTLVRAKAPKLVVEFGTSFGISTIHVAAALLDAGAGRVITAELEPHKVAAARANLETAGVASVVEFRQGDALQTLRELPAPIDLLFLDGWKDAYLPVLQMLEPQLAPGALVIADDLDVLPEVLAPYLAYVRARYLSVCLPLGDGMELSTRV